MKTTVFVTSILPKLNGSGVEQRCYRNCFALSAVSNVKALVLSANHDEREATTRLENAGAKEVLLVRPKLSLLAKRTFRGARILDELISLLKMSCRYDQQSQRHGIDWVSSPTDATFFVFRLATFSMLRSLSPSLLKRRHVVIDWDDIESLALDRSNAIARGTAGTEVYWGNKIQAARLSHLERLSIKDADWLTVCSESDAQSMNMQHRTSKFTSIPNTVHFDNHFRNRSQSVQEQVNILFVGSMYYPPNVHGAIWFCKSVLPKILQTLTLTIKVWIVGYKPESQIVALADSNLIEVTGSVDSVAPYYKSATLAVSPIHFGGGTRIKILEAAAYAVPTVTTTLGLEGIEFNHDREVLVANEPEAFAEQCISLANNKGLREKLAAAAFETGKRLYGHDVVKRSLQALIDPI